MIAGSATSLATPAAPTCTVRAAQSNETAFNTTITTIKIAAVNYFGTTAVSGTTSVTVASGQVVDVTIAPSTGSMQYNIYGNDGSHDYLFATCGGVKYTLQGFSTLPATLTAPASDTGTGKGTRMEGVVPTLSGLSAGGVYPSGWQGGYYNGNVGLHLNYNTVYIALKALWDSTSNSPGAFKADPAEIISSGSDLTNLSQDVISQGSATNYELFITQGDVGNVTVGAAVSQFQNPLTRSIMKLVVHPWYPQGNATMLSYQLPQTYTNVANAWEMSCVQDYVRPRRPWRHGAVTRRWDLCGSGNPSKNNRAIPMCGDARRAVETGNTGPVTSTRVRGIAHSRRRVKGQSKPAGRSNRRNCLQHCLASHRRNFPLLVVPLRCPRGPRPDVLSSAGGAPEQRHDSVLLISKPARPGRASCRAGSGSPIPRQSALRAALACQPETALVQPLIQHERPEACGVHLPQVATGPVVDLFQRDTGSHLDVLLHVLQEGSGARAGVPPGVLVPH